MPKPWKRRGASAEAAPAAGSCGSGAPSGHPPEGHRPQVLLAPELHTRGLSRLARHGGAHRSATGRGCSPLASCTRVARHRWHGPRLLQLHTRPQSAMISGPPTQGHMLLRARARACASTVGAVCNSTAGGCTAAAGGGSSNQRRKLSRWQQRRATAMCSADAGLLMVWTFPRNHRGPHPQSPCMPRLHYTQQYDHSRPSRPSTRDDIF